MRFDKTNFFHHFNTPQKTYSLKEITFQLECITIWKRESLGEGKGVKIVQEKIF